jgi:hypothetical protein
VKRERKRKEGETKQQQAKLYLPMGFNRQIFTNLFLQKLQEG